MGGVATPQAAAVLAEAASPAAPQMRVAFVCVNVGPRYSMEYVSILRDMVLRNSGNMPYDQAWFCITDRPDELPAGVYPIPADPALPGWWQKVRLFAPDMPWEPGDRIVYFDLDVAITGRLEDMVETKGIIKDWHWPMFNSSVMIWDAGEHGNIWTDFTPDMIDQAAEPEIAALLPKGQINAGDQHWITRCAPDWPTLPFDWCRSYRDAQGWPPSDCKVVVFHGNPKPDAITDGWVPKVWKVGGFTSLPTMKGANTSHDARMDNVRSAVKRDLPWFTGFRDEGRAAVVVCGAPSMRDYVSEIRAHKRRGASIVSVNNSWRFLVENGITPDVHVMLDARPENVEFVKGAPKSMRFVLASQCHPDVFDALEGYEVSVWHNGAGDSAELKEILAPWWGPGPDQRPCILVPGGSTVGLRCLWLATYSGFRTIHMFGIDSSYADDGSHHAYAQPLNDGETVLEVVRGEKKYRCAPWMTRQSAEFVETWRDLRAHTDFDGKPAPVTVHVHGRGLIPDIARELRAEAMAG